MWLLHEFSKYNTRMAYLKTKKDMLVKLAENPLSSAKEQADFNRWKDTIERLEEWELQKIRKRVGY